MFYQKKTVNQESLLGCANKTPNEEKMEENTVARGSVNRDKEQLVGGLLFSREEKMKQM